MSTMFDNPMLPQFRGWQCSEQNGVIECWRIGMDGCRYSYTYTHSVTNYLDQLRMLSRVHMDLVRDYPFVPFELNHLKLMYFNDMLFHSWVSASSEQLDIEPSSVLGGIMGLHDEIGKYIEMSYLQRRYAEIIAQERMKCVS